MFDFKVDDVIKIVSKDFSPTTSSNVKVGEVYTIRNIIEESGEYKVAINGWWVNAKDIELVDKPEYFSVGDKVRVNPQLTGFVDEAQRLVGEIVTISKVRPDYYELKEDVGKSRWYHSELEESILSKLLNTLQVEFGERFKLSDGNIYYITKQGEIIKDETGERVRDINFYDDIINGIYTRAWAPLEGDTVWLIDLNSKELVMEIKWKPDAYDLWYERGLVFDNKEDALEVANYLLEDLKY